MRKKEGNRGTAIASAAAKYNKIIFSITRKINNHDRAEKKTLQKDY